ncbi:MAG: FHA domain-containing protein [Planctomycetaceae bacterium]
MFGELEPCGGGDAIPLSKPRLLLGRRSSCDICLQFPNVSSQHCELEMVNGYWRLRDLGSRNGVRVNGERCTSKWLMPGDVISVAKHRFKLQYTAVGQAPPVEEENPFEQGLLEKAGLLGKTRQTDLARAAERADDAPRGPKYSLDE